LGTGVGDYCGHRLGVNPVPLWDLQKNGVRKTGGAKISLGWDPENMRFSIVYPDNGFAGKYRQVFSERGYPVPSFALEFGSSQTMEQLRERTKLLLGGLSKVMCVLAVNFVYGHHQGRADNNYTVSALIQHICFFNLVNGV